MKLDAVRSVVIGNIEAVDQGIGLIESLSDEQYQFVVTPYVKSTIGQHFRHVVDMFLAITAPKQEGLIDFDARRRGADIETCRTTAIAELQQIKDWMVVCLEHISGRLPKLEQHVLVQTEVTIEETHSVTIPTTTLRELIFASSHAVHHYALISVIAKLQGVELDENLGVAPATATFLREEAKEASASEKQENIEPQEKLACAQ
ncbi:DinB family protein [Agarilytica rhodophyticola]|uniref:DinB family protein n=1 Tax=Agarilytica rhodophyticola TaxID=1737490 RepID=UPI000B342DD3|nr:DinB family protein [Agarilytica rhodophyticola]